VSRRGCLVGVAVLLLVVAAPVLVFAPPMVRNNRELNEWKATLYDVPVPSGAMVEDRGTEFGLLGGNGNHCDFLAWLMLRTEASAHTIETHYQRALDNLEFGWVTAEQDGSGLVRVELFDSRESGWDLRCQ
jgi:hypothetical protein